MNLLLISDVHLDAPFAWAPPAAARGRRAALRAGLTLSLNLAMERGVDAVLVGGDLFEHDRVTPDTEAFLSEAFALLHPLPVYMAPGNHDWHGPASPYARARWSPNVHVFAEERLRPVEIADGVTLWGAAHRTPAGTAGFLRGFSVGRGGINLALFHGAERGWADERGNDGPHAPFDADEIAAAGLDHAFLGHFHRPRDAARHTYPGNPAPLAFGEDGERGPVLATVAHDGSVRRERLPVAVGGLHDLELDVTGRATREQVRSDAARLLDGLSGVARVTLRGEMDPDMDLHLADLGDVAPWLNAVVVRPGALTTGYDLARIVEERTVRGQFVRDAVAEIADPDERRRVIVTGLRALNGRDDLGVL